MFTPKSAKGTASSKTIGWDHGSWTTHHFLPHSAVAASTIRSLKILTCHKRAICGAELRNRIVSRFVQQVRRPPSRSSILEVLDFPRKITVNIYLLTAKVEHVVYITIAKVNDLSRCSSKGIYRIIVCWCLHGLSSVCTLLHRKIRGRMGRGPLRLLCDADNNRSTRSTCIGVCDSSIEDETKALISGCSMISRLKKGLVHGSGAPDVLRWTLIDPAAKA